MLSGDAVNALVFVAFGISLIARGLAADHLIDESDHVASEEEMAEAKATPVTRLLVVVAGALSSGYGFWMLFR